MSTMAVLNKTVCIQLSISLWTGQRRLKAEDFGDVATKLPPKTVASLGSLKLCDPAKLDELKNLKRAAERACHRLCVRFLGGYATNDDVLPKLTAELDTLSKEFGTKAQAFVNSLRSEIEDWKSKHSEWSAAIERALPDISYVAGRLQFGYEVFRVQPVSGDVADTVNSGLGRAIGGLAGQLFQEIEAEAEEAWKRSYENRDVVGQKALRPIFSIERKLEALQYLDARIGPVITQIRNILGSMPKHGEITGANLFAVIGLLSLLRSADAMCAHGDAALRGVSTVVSDMMATTSSRHAPVDPIERELEFDETPIQTPAIPPVSEPAKGLWF